jgi:di/tricarboxylate transporter
MRATPRTGASAVLGDTLSTHLSGQDVFMFALLVLALVAAVALTDVWSRSKERRQAALDVLDRIIRWRW